MCFVMRGESKTPPGILVLLSEYSTFLILDILIFLPLASALIGTAKYIHLQTSLPIS